MLEHVAAATVCNISPGASSHPRRRMTEAALSCLRYRWGTRCRGTKLVITKCLLVDVTESDRPQLHTFLPHSGKNGVDQLRARFTDRIDIAKSFRRAEHSDFHP